MRKAGFYFGGAILSVSALVLGAGCGPSEGGASGGSGGGTNTTTTTTTSTSSETTSSSNPTTGSTSTGGAAATCDGYCADIAKNCAGELAQYPSDDACKAACKGFPAGMPTDQKGATLDCHAYHAGMPAVADAKLHCPHAGPTGGDKIVSDMTEGVCGDGCTNFCNIALKACAGQTGAYTDLAACTTDCRKFKDNTQDPYNATFYTKMENWKNDFGCRMYHLSVAASSADAAKTHCPHIVSASPVCTK